MGKRPPAKTPQDRERQLVRRAIDLAEKQLLDGSAPPSVLTHYLRLGSPRYQLEIEKIQEENKLLRAKTKAIENSENLESLFREAMQHMTRYQGGDEDENV